jgi:signal transduction histidine kinase/CheY-like chemotaxis protein
MKQPWEGVSEELQVLIREHMQRFGETQSGLVSRANDAGREQILAMVLHNIGNGIIPVRVYLDEMNGADLEPIAHYLGKCQAHLTARSQGRSGHSREDFRDDEVLSFMGLLIESLHEYSLRQTATVAKLTRAVDYVSDILTLQQGRIPGNGESKERVALDAVIDDVVQMQAGALERRKIRVDCAWETDLPLLLMDRNRLTQVVVNLIKNAYESIEALGASTEKRWIRIRGGRDGSHVRIRITDSGVGIRSEEIASLFDLGISRKGSSGFGLHYCRKFLEANGGSILMASEGNGKGATVTILLPIRDSSQHSGLSTMSSHDSLLLIDDDEQLRFVAVSFLSEAGFNVLTAASGHEGIEVFRKYTEEISCVILDLHMPGMDGVQTYLELKRIRKDVPVVVSTGSDRMEASLRFNGEEGIDLIQKPYRSSTLIAKINEKMRRQSNNTPPAAQPSTKGRPASRGAGGSLSF